MILSLLINQKMYYSIADEVQTGFLELERLLAATLRADASSKLNPNDRWGYFPSLAAAWNIHKEEFF